MTMTLILILAGALVLGIVVLAMVVAVVLFLRNSGPDPAELRAEALGKLEYADRRDGTWSREMQGSHLIFHDRPDTLKWTIQLPRYNTMTLEMVEKSTGKTLEGPFEAGESELDARFLFGSPQRLRVVRLLGESKLQKALLRTPNLSLSLSADELVLEDAGKTGMKSLNNGTELDAEVAMHTLIGNVVNALFGVLYTEDGTVFDQYR